MNAKEWFKDLKFKLKIFIWYLVTEPFRQLKEIIYSLMRMFDVLNKTLTWAYVALVIVIISLFTGEKTIAGIFLLVCLIVILSWEWQRGFFMHRYRQSLKNRIKDEIKIKESPSVYGEIKKENGGK